MTAAAAYLGSRFRRAILNEDRRPWRPPAALGSAAARCYAASLGESAACRSPQTFQHRRRAGRSNQARAREQLGPVHCRADLLDGCPRLLARGRAVQLLKTKALARRAFPEPAAALCPDQPPAACARSPSRFARQGPAASQPVESSPRPKLARQRAAAKLRPCSSGSAPLVPPAARQ